MAVQQASQQPLNEQLDTYKTFLENLARIFFDMWKAYKVDGLKVLIESRDEQGKEQMVPYMISQEVLKSLKINIKIDITPRSSYDRYAQEQSLENLMEAEKITFEEYVEALEEDSVMPKAKLEKILKKREEKMQQIQSMEMQANEEQARLEQQMILEQRQQMDDEYNSMQSQAEGQYNELVNALGGGDVGMQ